MTPIQTKLTTPEEVEAKIIECQDAARKLWDVHFSILKLWREWLANMRAIESVQQFVRGEANYVPEPEEKHEG